VTDPCDILTLARTDPAARLVLADALQDVDGETRAARMAPCPDWCCERCGCPETEDWVCWDDDGQWHWLTDALVSSPEHYAHFFGKREAVESAVEAPKLTLVRLERWYFLCPHCRMRLARSRAATKANATRRANRDAARAAEQDAGGLFAKCE
jgi:hypothetical protein